ncbi:MarR family winged helix-turn-helix transcriptional regulator [Elusimicrobium simillimum]|uniref:MarR family winged helix-turn-helix transcriptional regulator n=1 Tax=Elusimicrobium simillimum TaxID=3143438 RepID=UPI003C6FFD17
MLTKELQDYIKRFRLFNAQTTSQQRFIHVLALIYNKLEKRLNTSMLAFGLTTPQFNILAVLARSDAAYMTQVEISKRMFVTQGSITRLIDRLYQDGLITRTEDKKDRRNKLIKLTVKGKKLYGKIWPAYNKVINDALDNIADSKIDESSEALIAWLYKIDNGGKNA